MDELCWLDWGAMVEEQERQKEEQTQEAEG